MATRRSAVGVALSAALLTALAACGGGSSAADPSSPLPITTTPTRSTATASATATIDPNSDAAVNAGVKRWADALTRSAHTANISAIAAAATARCSCIQGAAQSVDYLVANNLHLTVAYKVSSSKIVNRDATTALVQATIAAGPYSALRADGTVFKSEAGDTGSSEFSLKLVGSKWLVDTII